MSVYSCIDVDLNFMATHWNSIQVWRCSAVIVQIKSHIPSSVDMYSVESESTELVFYILRTTG